MRTVFVTGAAGFVGAALTAKLKADGAHVVSLVRDWTRAPSGTIVRGDVTDLGTCRRVLADYEVDTVYHLAAQSIVSACAEDPLTALEVAVMGTARLLQAVREAARPIRVIVSTSDKVYGAAPSPYTEDTPLDARHAYEVSKACQDLVARMFDANYDVDVQVLRAVNIYGPGDPNETRLIPRTARRLLRGELPLLHAGAGEMRRQYLYIDDMVRALRTLAERGRPGEAYCAGSLEAPMSVLEVMQAMTASVGLTWADPEVRGRDARFCEIGSQQVQDDKIRALGWTPQICFQEGLRRTLDWYRSSESASAPAGGN